ncbi:MAG: hypothetical protein KF723_22920 [Rhizobiaceae bacterium]|nr:hypothetical protein [Rhizobiaceae bacterium]
MSIFVQPASLPSTRTIAGGEGSLGSIAGASLDSLLYVENANAVHAALEEVYDRRAREVHSATGVQLGNPVLDAYDDFRQAQAVWQAEIAAGTARADGPPAFETYFEQRQKDWDAALSLAAGKNPDTQVRDRLMRSIEGEAINLTRDSDERMALLMESRAGVGKWIAAFAGGAAGSLADPITLMSLAAGGGPGAARTVIGRIMTVAGKEALINAGTEAAVQPFVQRYREQAGLPAGFDEAMTNVLFAGAVGGVLGGAGRVVGELAAGRGGRRVLAEQAAAAIEPAPARGPSASMEAPLAAPSLPARIDAPEVRGAAMEAARVVQADLSRPAAAAADVHERSLAVADRAIATRDADVWPGFEPDQAQIERVAAAIVGVEVQAAAPTNPLSRFLAGLGGVREQGGELAMIGIDRHTSTGAGKLLSRNGLTLDYAREAAAEAGFFDHLYGTPDEALGKSTPRDLIDMLDAEQRARAASGPEAQLAGVETTLAEIARLAGPGLPDAVLERAGRLAADGMDAGDALERVLVRDELGAEAEPRGGQGAESEPLPGWGDEELWAAGENRGGRPEADETLSLAGEDDPFAAELADADPAAEIPWFDGNARLSDVLDDVKHTRGLASLVEACRV